MRYLAVFLVTSILLVGFGVISIIMVTGLPKTVTDICQTIGSTIQDITMCQQMPACTLTVSDLTQMRTSTVKFRELDCPNVLNQE